MRPPTREREEALRERLLRPERPLLRECLECARAYRSPAEAWEGLYTKGLLPASWIDDPARRFTLPSTFFARKRVVEKVDPEQIATLSIGDASHDQLRALPYPTTASFAAFLAADLPNAARAEQLAREVHDRWLYWISVSDRYARVLRERRLGRMLGPLPPGEPAPESSTLVWRLRRRALRSYRPHRVELDGVIRKLLDVSIANGWTTGAPIARNQWWRTVNVPDELPTLVNASARWERFFSEGLAANITVADFLELGSPEAPFDRPFAELKNPFEPLLELLETGYALTHLRRGVLVLDLPDANLTRAITA